MLDNIRIEDILFLDIETIPAYSSYQELPKVYQDLWDKKAKLLAKNEEDTTENLYERAGIYSEFGKIICISVGAFKDGKLWLKSFFDHDEYVLLKEFAEMLNKGFYRPNQLLCAHNGKEFDYPYIARRMLINGINPPMILNLAGKKPWEIQLLDTMELWKFGDYKNYTSLELLSAVFGIPSPKNDICGADVAKVYWIEKDLERIVEYCQKDVVTIVQIFLKYQCKEILSEDCINIK
jgi:DNA polymerase elongation subunit (family B)